MQKTKPFLITWVFLLCCFMAEAQNTILTGIVKDSANGKTMAGVSIFLNGTSKGTVSRNDGSYTLQVPQGRYQLIVSAIGYANYITEINSHHLPPTLTIQLHTAADELAAITVEPYLKNGWAKYGDTFLQYFIGTTKNASRCKIKNKEVLRFHFYPKSNKLSVTAIEPLRIENKALGYELEYRLDRFLCDFNAHLISYMGYPLFHDMTTDEEDQKKKWEENRQLAYMGSMMHFMRSLYNNTVKDEGFIVKFKYPVLNIEKKRIKEIYHPNITPNDSIPIDTLHHYWEVLREPDYFLQPTNDPAKLLYIQPDQTHVMFFYEDCSVIYGYPKRGIAYTESAIRLMNEHPIAIDENGNYYPQNEILNLLNWSITENMSNLLPRDYVSKPLPDLNP